MGMLYRSRVPGTRNITKARIGFNGTVNPLIVDLLNEINPSLDNLVRSINSNQAVLSIALGNQIHFFIVG